MGLPKATLPFGSETMLSRVVRLVGEVCDPVVVVAAAEQVLPELPREVIVARDRQQGFGPLAGISAGLAALPESASAAFVTGCDVPLLKPALVRRLFELLEDHAAVVPTSGGYLQPLTAVYTTGVRDLVDQMLAADRLSPGFLFDCIATRRVGEAELRAVDPQLDSLRNVNDPAVYLAALADAGFAAPPEVLAKLDVAGTRRVP